METLFTIMVMFATWFAGSILIGNTIVSHFNLQNPFVVIPIFVAVIFLLAVVIFGSAIKLSLHFNPNQ